MSYAHTLHDEINLKGLVRRLEKTTSEGWDELPRDQSWIKALGMLQKLKFARKLLKTVDLSEEEQTPQRIEQLNAIRIQLDKIEASIREVEGRTAPQHSQPVPILPTIPQPALPSSLTLDLPTDLSSSSMEHGGESGAEVYADELLPADTPAYPSSRSTSFPTPMTLIPTLPPSTSAYDTNPTAISTGAAPRHLQNSSALQQELSDQLAQMATQLKRNALHFSDTLSRDQAVVEDTKQKLESNFDVMQKERIRLRDHRGKSRSTTCLVVLIVLTVMLLFVLMISIIRFT